MLSLAGSPETRQTWDACKLVEGQQVAHIRGGDSRRGPARSTYLSLKAQLAA